MLHLSSSDKMALKSSMTAQGNEAGIEFDKVDQKDHLWIRLHGECTAVRRYDRPEEGFETERVR